MPHATARKDWYLVSSHGSLLFFVAANPQCTVDEIARQMHLTRRTVWGLIGDLRRAGMLDVRRNGRRHHYAVNLDAPFPHQTIAGIRLRTIFGAIAQNGAHSYTPR